MRGRGVFFDVISIHCSTIQVATMRKLEAPRGLRIEFSPSSKQYEVWQALQGNRCDKCGGDLVMKPDGKDKNGHTIWVPTCSKCGNTDIPELILMGGSAGGGKALSLNSSVLTPCGFRRLGDIRPGDIVTGADGDTQEVTAVHPKGKFNFYKIYFSDGTSVECSEGHLWTLQKKYSYPEDFITLETRELFKSGWKRYQLPLCKQINFSCVNGDVKFQHWYERTIYVGDYLRTHSRLERNGVFFVEADNEEDCDTLLFVIRSLGGFARKFTFHSRLYVYYRIFATTKDIVRIEPIGQQESFCISVSNKDGLYVVDDFTVTHNSFLGCAWVVTSCFQYPGVRMVLARRELKNLIATTWATMLGILNDWGLEQDVHYHVNNQRTVLSFWNGSSIIGLDLAPSLQDPLYNRLGSLEISGAFCDEVSEIPERAIEVLQSRIRYRIAESFIVGKCCCSTNPCLTWVRSTFVMDDDGNPVKLAKGLRYLPFSLFDNPNEKFRMVYYNRLSKIRDKATRDRLLFGNWSFTTDNKMAVYYNFDGERHLVNGLFESAYDKMKPVIISFDWNTNPYMSALVLQIDWERKTLYFIKEFTGKAKDKLNNSPAFGRFIANELIAWGHIGGVDITGDPSGMARSTQTEAGVNNFTIINKALIAKGIQNEVKVFNTQPAQVRRIEFVNEVFRQAYGWTVKIDLRCRRLAEDFSYQMKNPDGTKEKKKVLMEDGTRAERYGHLSDCFDYAVCYYLQSDYARFVNGDAEDITTISDPAMYGDFDY